MAAHTLWRNREVATKELVFLQFLEEHFVCLGKQNTFCFEWIVIACLFGWKSRCYGNKTAGLVRHRVKVIPVFSRNMSALLKVPVNFLKSSSGNLVSRLDLCPKMHKNVMSMFYVKLQKKQIYITFFAKCFAVLLRLDL